MAYRIIVLTIVFLTACEGLLQAVAFQKSLRDATALRHIILSRDDMLGHKICNNPSPALLWQWRDSGIWTDVCSSFTGFSPLPRFWKVQLSYKYKLLFRWELPITVSIVILS